ncbi:MAG: MauE/DoxX family redox-associated membrane protein [Jatrophihabitantaceae bacterium]
MSAAALLLAAAGLAKLRQRAPLRSAFAAAAVPGARRLPPALANRLAGSVELALAVLALGVGGRLGALPITLGFGMLAVLSARMVAIEFGQDCGCFNRPSPVTHWHTGVNLAGLLIGVLGLLFPGRSLLAELGRQPVTGAALLLAAAVLAYLGYLTMTALPALRAAAGDLELV